MLASRDDLGGGYAQQRYRSSLRRWRRSTLPLLRWIFWPVLCALVLLAAWRRVGYADWVLGLLTGGFLGTYVCLAGTPPEYVTRWAVGATGERRTARVLRRMSEDGIVAVHDIQREFGNVDHLAVTPSGVYLIETKNLQGSARFQGNRLVIGRSDHPDDEYAPYGIGARVRAAAYEVSQEIASLTGEKIWVQGLVVMWNRLDEGPTERDRVAYVQGASLNEWLKSRPAVLSPARYRAALRYLAASRH